MPDSASPLAAALTGRYTIERELGRGGMATVYLARDLRHDRPVALKVLHPELAAAMGAGRFQQEIRLAARLQHPHILTVHDSGEISAAPGTPPLLWFSMPFIEGESLRDRLIREKQLPLDEALRITREAADALDYAHRHGVIHRDIKPENILLSDGHALVADFGISKALAKAGDERLTETGMALGTPAYMSPEQAAGERDLDPRTDVYSLGTVLYEMLAGDPPFAAPTAQAMIARRFKETPRPLREVRETVPPGVEQAVQRALSRTAADRFATAAQFAQALQALAPTVATVAETTGPQGATRAGSSAGRFRRPPVAVVTLLLGFLIGLGILFAWRRNHSASDDAGIRYVAVLPFENVGDSEDEYFADGVTDAVRGKLSTIPGLEVIAGRSSSEYKKSTKSLGQIARELGVGYLVVAKIRWAKGADGASRVQVSPELVQIPTGGAPTTRWQQPFDASMTDVFQVQADIAGRVVQELGVALADSARRQMAEQPTRSLPAYDLFLKAEGAALAAGRNDPASLRQAIALYDRALALDPDFALAWAQMSRATSVLYGNTAPSRDLADRARGAAERALALAPGKAASHIAMAMVHRTVERDTDRAKQRYAEARRLAPQDAQTLTAVSGVERDLGRLDSALALLRQAERLDPRSATIAAATGTLLQSLRRHHEADSAFRRSLELSPGNTGGVHSRVEVQLARGDLARAHGLIRAAELEIDPKALAIYLATYNDLYWVLDSAQQDLVLQGRPDDFDGDLGSWGLALAQIYAARGDGTRARAYADSARLGFAEQIAAAPKDGQPLALHALSLAYLGRTAEAIREGERAAELIAVSHSQIGVYIRFLRARIYVMAGQPDEALDNLEAILSGPGALTPAWLRLDPSLAALRGNPRFQRLKTSPR